MGDLAVRAPTSGDVADLVGFAIEMARESEGRTLDADRVRRGIEAAVAGSAGGTRYFVAEHDGDLVGTLFVSREWSDWNAGWYWWIQGAYTVPSHRGAGVFTALHDAVIAAATADGDVVEVRLYVETDNPARSLYEGLGFEEEPYRVYGRRISRAD